jgi:hypothetical protein
MSIQNRPAAIAAPIARTTDTACKLTIKITMGIVLLLKECKQRFSIHPVDRGFEAAAMSKMNR